MLLDRIGTVKVSGTCAGLIVSSEVRNGQTQNCITTEEIARGESNNNLPAHQVENEPDPEAEEEIENLDQDGVFDRISQKRQYAMAVLDERRGKMDGEWNNPICE